MLYGQVNPYIVNLFVPLVGNIPHVPGGMPMECMPVEGKKRGRLSYTIEDGKSGAKVEVLLKGKAFRIVKISVISPNGSLKQDLLHYFLKMVRFCSINSLK